ncbi:MAG TPA: PDZ domain-containing protein, partial [Sedimentisphaerales bacterium]|nr:PDZ domain-containing protein [Sedimentisphaerales bacterium]
ENIPQSIRERGGAYLAMVIPGGPADEAGMRQGDIVLTFGDEEISSGSELVESIRAKLPGVVVRCTYWRDGEIHNASVKLAERPSSEQVIAESQGDPTTYAYRTLGIMASGWTGRIIEGGAVMRIRGMMVDFIRPGSPAAEAGLVRGDLIEEVNGQRVPDARRLDEALSAGDLDEGIRVKAISQAGERTVLIKR